ncbi:hypothetical protein B7463_g8881, partial [Scytalidium lignicola]
MESCSRYEPENSKRRYDGAKLEMPHREEDGQLDTNATIVAWGYMPDHKYLNLGSAMPAEDHTIPINYTGDPLVEEVLTTILTLPPRSLTDLLVQNFLYHVNYFYYTVYPPQFLKDYTEWWSQRAEGASLSPVFTCLLIRVCSYSIQYVNSSMHQRFETELSESVQVLTERYHKSAEKLSRCFAPGKGGLMHVQQLFLTALWYKSESKFVESWHALNSAIREAQEIGLHKDILAKNSSDFDMEMRRRIWCLLYVWDWQMSKWLSRPLLIDQRCCAVGIPSLHLEESNQQSNPPSPFTPVLLQYQLCLKLSNFDREWNNPTTILNEIETWTNSFPEVYRFTNPDTSWDRDYLYVRFHREHLHAISSMYKLELLKPCLTKNIRQDLSEIEKSFRAMAIDTCLNIVETARRLFDIAFPTDAKAFILSYATFDPATIMTSAIIHDEDRTLPQRQEVLVAIESALTLLRQLSITRIGAMSHGILSRLVFSLPLDPEERAHFPLCSSKRQKKDSSMPESPLTVSSGYQTSNSISTGPGPTLDALSYKSEGFSALNLPDDAQWDLLADKGFSFPTVSDFENAYFGGLEEIWDWESLNLAVSGPDDASVLFGAVPDCNLSPI